MSEPERIKKLEEENKELRKNLDEIIKATSEDAQAYSIYSKAKDFVRNWILLWVGVFAIASGLSYNKAINLLIEKLIEKPEVIIEVVKKVNADPKTSDKIVEKILERDDDLVKAFSNNPIIIENLIDNPDLISGVKNDAVKRIAPSIKKEVKNEILNNADGYLEVGKTYTNEQIAMLEDKLFNKLNELIEEKNKIREEDLKIELLKIEKVQEYSVKKGFTYYGHLDDGSWDRTFTVKGRNGSTPERGDTLEANTTVNIRDGYIRRTFTGFKNEPIIGVIQKGDLIDVVEVKEIGNNKYWVKFNNRRRSEQ